jgi:hypothetical protein
MPLLSSLRSTTFWGVSRRTTTVVVPEVPALFSFTTHTFTTGSTVGRFGPLLSTLRSSYSGQSWASDSSYFFQGRAQGYQVWQVPATGIYEIEIAGARGQASSSNIGYGLGAIVKAQISLSVTDRLEMVVGQVPGNGGSTNPGNSYAGSGGGSFVGLYGTNTPIIVAGGGAGLYNTWTSVQSIHNGQTRRQPRFTGYNYGQAVDGTDPDIGGGGRGYHGGGGGGWFTAGLDYANFPGTAAMSTGSGGQNFTHGASFVGSSVSNGSGTWYATGGNATALTSEGGFGGGGGGHSGNNSSGGGGGYSGGHGGQTSAGGSYLSGIGGGSFIREGAISVATSNGQYDGSSTFGGTSVTNIGLFNDSAGYIKITKLSGGTGGAGGYIFSASFSTYNANFVTTSNNIGLSSSFTADTINGSTYYGVTDAASNKWYILANWSFGGTPGRWGNVMNRDLNSINGVNIISRVSQQSATSSLATQVTPGVMYVDAVSFSNQSGLGFANWYTDDKNNQAYPNLNTAITNATPNQTFDSASGLNNTGGAVWFEPPLGTREVMMDFANSHSNGPCTISVVEKSTGTVKYVIHYAQFAGVATGSGAINDSASRTVIFRHTAGDVYFNTDHGGTISGSHYYLFR